jgi:hypothetical protein
MYVSDTLSIRYEGITKEEYTELVKLDKKMESLEKQIKISRKKLKLKIDTYTPSDQIKLISDV